MKNMKKFKYILLATALIIYASCGKNFLELYPEGNLNTGIFYKNTQDFQQALIGAYVPLRDISNIAFYMDEMRSDNTHYDYYAKDRGNLAYEQLADFLDDSQNGVIAQRYSACYNGISRANVILDRLEKINFPMAEADKRQIIGEAKALRAHYYFDLVRHFGKVPLHIHEVLDKESAYLPQSSEEEIYAKIIDDFTEALDKVSSPKLPQGTGRITKGMVASELAMAYMVNNRYDKSIPLLQSVVKMGYGLWTNYGDAFKIENQNKMESVFEVQYKDGTDGQSSSFIYKFIPIGNTLKILGINYNNNNAGWNIPTLDLIESYERNDKRLDASIGVIEGTINKDSDFIASRIASESARNYAPKPGVAYKYFIRKYYHPPYLLANNTKENWPVIRYSNVLLMLAESLNEWGQSGAALPYLNQVRKRAGLGDVTTIEPSELRDIIAKERRMELAFENSRWLDLVRTKQAIPVMTAFGIKQKAAYGHLSRSAYTITESKYIFAIPYREMTINKKLIQNTGY